MKINIIPSVLAILALSVVARAVSPAPDGGYPGGNTAEGENALFSLSTGIYNTAVGFLSLKSNTDGQFNTGLGAGTLLANTGDGNTAAGAGALLANLTGGNNTAGGAFALFSNTTGTDNTATGVETLLANTTGSSNLAYGDFALLNNIVGNSNTAVGYRALQNTTGSNNIGLGIGAGSNLTTGDSNIDIDSSGVAGESNTIRIGNVSHTATFMAGVSNSTPGGISVPVLIGNGGQLGTNSSSRRFKKDVKPMDHDSESILALKPVTFHYKRDKIGAPQFGLIAEEVAEINPDLVVRDKDGEIYTVRYDAVNAMLLNEFLKEHKTVQRQNTTIAELKKEIASLTASVKWQAAQIEKVSAQLDGNKPHPDLVFNDP